MKADAVNEEEEEEEEGLFKANAVNEEDLERDRATPAYKAWPTVLRRSLKSLGLMAYGPSIIVVPSGASYSTFPSFTHVLRRCGC